VIAASRRHGSRWLLRFVGCDSPEGARELSGGELVVAEEDARPAPEGSYYSHQVEGWRCEDLAGASLGTVAGLETTPAGALLTVRTPEGKPVLVPFVEGIVSRMDPEGRRVVLDPPEGLFEL